MLGNTLTMFFYSTSACGNTVTANIRGFKTDTSGTGMPESNDVVFIISGAQSSDPFAPLFWTNGGRINLIPNGTYGAHSSGNSQTINAEFTVVNGIVTSTILCSDK